MLLLSASTIAYGKNSLTMDADPQKTADDIVLVVSGTGATKEAATAVALRSAIEQAFGTFVSANTTILNDELVRDEIATITSGNIKSFKELACLQDEAGVYHVSVSALVSIGKLISYAQAHGSSAEFSGQTFIMNMKMRELNKQNEADALLYLLSQLRAIQDILFDFEINAKDPKQKDDGWLVPVELKIRPNKNNYLYFIDILVSTLSSLSLSPEEREQYKTNDMDIYHFSIRELIESLEMIGPTVRTSYNGTGDFYLRNDPIRFSFYLTKLYSEALASFTIKTLGGETKTAYLTDYDGLPSFDFPSQHSNTKIEHDRSPRIKHSWSLGGMNKLIYFNFDTASLYKLHGFEVVRTPISEIQIERMINILNQLGRPYHVPSNGSISFLADLNRRNWDQGEIVVTMKDFIVIPKKANKEDYDAQDPDNYVFADYIIGLFEGYRPFIFLNLRDPYCSILVKSFKDRDLFARYSSTLTIDIYE